MAKLYFSAMEVARELNQSLWRIQYVIKRDCIQPAHICGGRSCYGRQQLKEIKSKLKKIRKYSNQNKEETT